MTNSDKMNKALDKALKEVLNMSDKELRDLWDDYMENQMPDPVFEKWIVEALGFNKENCCGVE